MLNISDSLINYILERTFTFIVHYRSLKVYADTGVTYTEHLKRQKETEGGNDFGGGLRFKNTVIFWINSEQVNFYLKCNYVWH